MSADRDRDGAGRPRNARPRDELGRPLSRSAAAPAGLLRIPDDLPVTPAVAAGLGGRLLAEGLPFQAHEVFEAAWRSVPGPERELWRGLAQIAVGLTHARRGNARGAVALLRRGAGRLREHRDGLREHRDGQREHRDGQRGHGAEERRPAPGGAAADGGGYPDIDAAHVAATAERIAARIARSGLGGMPEADLRIALRPGP